MLEFYQWVIVLLFVLAISDLIVGVSNDAVNFLNSAIGSRVAPRLIIMVVASLGILAGATFSNGMIEVARKGIFNPEFFLLTEIMVIFLAVMITDIILLDLFNTYGMPTSTTVSIVFELLGAAVAVAVLKLSADPGSVHQLADFINTSSAMIIISGIFISVFIAFFTGVLVQYVSRLLFTFQLNKRMAWAGPLWCALALTALTFFLLIKGMKGASFVSDDFIGWTQDHRLTLMGLSLIIWWVLMQLAVQVMKWNILKFVVLFGTFSLAMAFAGNDLVNFIGVPIAGLESYLAWNNSGVAADQYTMAVLNEPVRTETWILATAGAIMVITLWFSKKSRSVTETEVNLGRQDEGSERFEPNALSKGIVRMSLPLGRFFERLIPPGWAKRAQDSFAPYLEPIPQSGIGEPPAFDLVRASVNLTVASVLIAFATSLKLPLSTTYVSFMVAMGASLADKAWGRESAVYRVAGVLNVIGGWFFTAFIAFTASAVFATLIYYFQGWAILALVGLIVFMVFRTYLIHRNKRIKQAALEQFEDQTESIDAHRIIRETRDLVIETLGTVRDTYTDTFNGLLTEDRAALKQSRKDISRLNEENALMQHKLYKLIKRTKLENARSSRIYLLVYDLQQDLVQSMSLIVNSCFDHVDHCLKPLKQPEADQVKELAADINQYVHGLQSAIANWQLQDQAAILAEKQVHYNLLEDMLEQLVKRIQNGQLGRRKSQLMFNLVLESKDIIAITTRFLKLYARIERLEQDHSLSLISGQQLSD